MTADENLTDDETTESVDPTEGGAPRHGDGDGDNPGAASRDAFSDSSKDATEDASNDPPLDEGDAQGDNELQRLSEENQFLLDQVQRARAEFENFRRRTTEERTIMRRRLTMDVFRRVIPLYDALQLAVVNDSEGSKLLEGVQIIAAEFAKVLSDFEIEPIATVGEPFDPHWHEAMFQEETDQHPAGHVLEEFERGYRMGEELIRPARVKVAKAPQKSE